MADMEDIALKVQEVTQAIEGAGDVRLGGVRSAGKDDIYILLSDITPEHGPSWTRYLYTFLIRWALGASDYEEAEMNILKIVPKVMAAFIAATKVKSVVSDGHALIMAVDADFTVINGIAHRHVDFVLEISDRMVSEYTA